MPELVGVIKWLEKVEGVEKVSLGRRLRGPAVAPVFQVGMIFLYSFV